MARQPDVFRPSHVAIVRAGEMSGSLAVVLRDLCATIDRQVEVSGRVAGAAIYPAILLTMALFALGLIFFVMAPALVPLFEGQAANTPLILTVAMAATDFIRSYGLQVAILFVLLIAAFIGIARTEAFKERRDRAILWAPLFGRMVREAEAARFARISAILLKSGVPLTQALSITADALQNRSCRQSLRAALEALKKGAKPAEALTAFVALPSASRSLIAIGEETNRLPEMLSHVAEMNEKALERRIDRLMTLLTPALTVGIGLVVGGLILSVRNAILSANDLAF
jgi:general secretion pathway protein F